MTLSLTRRVLGGLGGVALSLALATTVLAAGPTWQPATDIRVKSSWFLLPEDVGAAGSKVVAVWMEFDLSSDATRVGFKVSDDAGASFGALHLIPGATAGRGAICGSQAKVVTTRMNTPTTWAVELSSTSVSGGPVVAQTVATSSEELTQPDVACTNGRIFVSWRIHTVDNNVGLRVASALRTDGVFGPPMSLGQQDRDFPTGLALAASGNDAYAAFNRLDGRLRVKHWTEGAGPAFPLSSSAASIIGPGRSGRPTYDPSIDAHRNTVALTWGKCANTLARVSSDAAATWGPIRMIEDDFGCNVEDAFSGPNSIAVRRSRLAAVYNISGIPNASIDFLVTSKHRFASFTRSELGEHQHHEVTFVRVGSGLKLADLFNGPNGHRIKFRRQV
jgi:hypothetical protein